MCAGLSRVVVWNALLQVSGSSNIALIRKALALREIDVVHVRCPGLSLAGHHASEFGGSQIAVKV
jgi:hypothetical protein